MATAANTASINSSENWQRINLIGELCIKESLLDILHNRNNDPSYCGLPQTALQLYQRMLAFKTAHEKALRRIIRPNQWDVICPSSGNCNSRDWDITIIKVIIQYENLIPPPIGGWEISSPCILDITKAAHVCRAKDIRNELKHGTIKDMCDVNKYNNLISRIEVALLGMNYSNMALFYELKHCSLQVYTPQTVQILQQRLSDVRDELANLKIDNNDIRNNLAADFSHISDTIQQNYDDVIELVNKSISDLSSENQNLLTEQINKFSDVYQFVENHRMKIEEDIVVITNRLDELQNQASSISQENDQNKKRIDENEIRNQAKFNQHDKELKNLKEEGKKSKLYLTS